MVKNSRLHFAIRVCAELLNLKGGEVPNAKLLPVLQQRINELGEGGTKVEWLKEISERFDIHIPETGAVKEYQKKVDPSGLEDAS